jgi:hypothetical protein
MSALGPKRTLTVALNMSAFANDQKFVVSLQHGPEFVVISPRPSGGR